ncbi:hypothetical protein MC885_015141, partial [Smutsia gigantea]
MTPLTTSPTTAASIPGTITPSSKTAGTTPSPISEPFTTGIVRTSLPITSTFGSPGTTGIMGTIFTSPWHITGTTGVSGATMGGEDGSTGEFRTGTPRVSESFTATPRSKTPSGRSTTPGTTSGGTAGTTGRENAATTGAAGENTSGASGTEKKHNQ